MSRDPAHHCDVQRLTNREATEMTLGLKPGGDASFDAAEVRLGGRNILLARDMSVDVDRYAEKIDSFDCGQAFLGA